MVLSPAGTIANNYWENIRELYPQVRLHQHQVMPDHIHGIIELERIPTEKCELLDSFNAPGNAIASVKNEVGFSVISPKAGSISAIIRSYKSACTTTIRRELGIDFSWQSRFHDHIIRNDQEFVHISQYIRNNPGNWKKEPR